MDTKKTMTAELSAAETLWHTPATLEQLNELTKDTIAEVIGIEITELGPNYIKGTMPGDKRTFQPMGRIHGGANVVLAETLGSFGANLIVDTSRYYCLGQEINANHVRGATGLVTGTATLAYRGRTSQVWEIKIVDERGKLTCISRITMAVLKYT